MERYKFVFIGIFFTLNVFGTNQIPDLLIYNGDTLLIVTYPLESYFRDQNIHPDSVFMKDCFSTACWRGYQAVWEIKADSLFLVSILDCCYNDRLILYDSVFADLEELLSPEIMECLEPFHGNIIPSQFGLERLRHKMGDVDFYKYRDEILKISLRARKSVDLKLIFDSGYRGNKVYAFWYNGKLNIKPSSIGYDNQNENESLENVKLLLKFTDGILSLTENAYEE